MKSRKRQISEGLKLQEQERIRMLGEKENRKEVKKERYLTQEDLEKVRKRKPQGRDWISADFSAKQREKRPNMLKRK